MIGPHDSERTVRVLRGPRLILPDRCLHADLLLAGGNIVGVTAPGEGEGEEVWDLTGTTIAPGLIDAHTHGGWGVDFGQADAETIAGVANHYAKDGVTRLLITLYPGPEEYMVERLRVAAAACRLTPAFLGVHLEGPFLAADRRGALPEAGILPFDPELFRRLRAAADGYLRVMTFAPEAIGPDDIARIRSQGVTLSIGHTSADAGATRAALSAGVERATHICNAMPPIHHRNPGPVLPLLLSQRVRVEVIADGQHLDDEMLTLIHRLKGRDGMMVVSDSMPLAGMGPGAGTFCGAEVASDGVRATLADGTLAGSVTPLGTALRRLGSVLDIPEPELIALAAGTPAADLRLPSTGRVASGTCADLVVFDDTMTVIAALRNGERADDDPAIFLPASLPRLQ